jgi:hypothetical protein
MAYLTIRVLRHAGQPADGPAAVFDELGGTLGRSDRCELVLPDAERNISRVHARVRWAAGRFTIEVCGAHPLKLNGRSLATGDRAPLAPGDTLHIGPYELVVAGSDAPLSSGREDAFRDLFIGSSPLATTPAVVPAPATAAAPVAPTTPIPDDWDPFAPAEPIACEPVWMAVTAPSQLPTAQPFVAALAVHVASLRAKAEQQLRRIGGPHGEPLMDLAPANQSGWVAGAPVTVTLQVRGGRAEPPQQSFAWNGRLHLLGFQVHPDGSGGPGVGLGFHVLLAGVPMAWIPLQVAWGGEPPPAAPRRQPAPASAFASYASADAQAVGLCLSALARWAPDLAIFQDCLDLRPGEAYKPQLAQRIADAEAFLLFWSRRAAASPWVRWELDTACRDKPPEALIPMPLEDPAVAPPPPELADRHWRDRFMVARQAWAHVQDQLPAIGAQEFRTVSGKSD